MREPPVLPESSRAALPPLVQTYVAFLEAQITAQIEHRPVQCPGCTVSLDATLTPEGEPDCISRQSGTTTRSSAYHRALVRAPDPVGAGGSRESIKAPVDRMRAAGRGRAGRRGLRAKPRLFRGPAARRPRRW
jgi:hypothetical protein